MSSWESDEWLRGLFIMGAQRDELLEVSLELESSRTFTQEINHAASTDIKKSCHGWHQILTYPTKCCAVLGHCAANTSCTAFITYILTPTTANNPRLGNHPTPCYTTQQSPHSLHEVHNSHPIPYTKCSRQQWCRKGFPSAFLCSRRVSMYVPAEEWDSLTRCVLLSLIRQVEFSEQWNGPVEINTHSILLHSAVRQLIVCHI